MRFILIAKNNNIFELQLKAGNKVLGNDYLTPSQDFDTMLIVAIDRLLTKNKIDRLSLKSFKILGKTRPGAVSSMLIKTVKIALEI